MLTDTEYGEEISCGKQTEDVWKKRTERSFSHMQIMLLCNHDGKLQIKQEKI